MQEHHIAGEAGRRAPSWFLARGDKRYGPLADRELLLLAERGGLRTDDLLWRPGFTSWKSVQSVCGVNASNSIATPKSVFPQDAEYLSTREMSAGPAEIAEAADVSGTVKPKALEHWSTDEIQTAAIRACWITFKVMRPNASCGDASWHRTENSHASYITTLLELPLFAGNVHCCSRHFLANCYWLSLTLSQSGSAESVRFAWQSRHRPPRASMSAKCQPWTSGLTLIAPPAVLNKRSLVIGFYREDMSLGSDIDWICRANDAGINVQLVEEVLLFRRVHQADALAA